MDPFILDLLEAVVKGIAVLTALVLTVRYFGAPLLQRSVREALAPELTRLARFEADLEHLRSGQEAIQAALETKRARLGDLDRRVNHNNAALSAIPSLRASMDFLTAEIARGNAMVERALAGQQDLAIQLGRLQGAHDELRRGSS